MTVEGAYVNILLSFLTMSLRGTDDISIERQLFSVVHARVPWQSPERVLLVCNYLLK